MQVSFGQIYRANVFLNSKRVLDSDKINKITNQLARDLSGSKKPENYGDLTHQQRILLRMFDGSYKIPTEKKEAGIVSDSTVSMVTIPNHCRYMIVGKEDNLAMDKIRHDSIGIEHYHKDCPMDAAYLSIFKNNALEYIRKHLSPYEVNIQAQKNSKGDIYISLIDFKKSN